jgi:hypothetical protein
VLQGGKKAKENHLCILIAHRDDDDDAAASEVLSKLPFFALVREG